MVMVPVLQRSNTVEVSVQQFVIEGHRLGVSLGHQFWVREIVVGAHCCRHHYYYYLSLLQIELKKIVVSPRRFLFYDAAVAMEEEQSGKLNNMTKPAD